MKRDGLKRTMPVALAAAFAALIATGAGFTTNLAAQTPQGTLPAPGTPEAPVGHRQPRQSDLPPSALRDEQNNVPSQGNEPGRRNADREKSTFGELPTICVKC